MLPYLCRMLLTSDAKPDGADMDLKTLNETPPWEWPEDAGRILLDILRDQRIVGPDRLLAAELAGEFTVINDELADALLSIVQSDGETEELRAHAVISLGPALDFADTEGFDDPEDLLVTEKMFHRIQESLRKLYRDAKISKEVRRRILEAAVCAPEDWHQEAVRAAYSTDDEDWKLTAVFCMRYVRGFDDQILEALESKNPEIHCEAVCAAGNWGVEGAWPHIAALVKSKTTDKPLLLAAIEAVPGIRPHGVRKTLGHLLKSKDEDIVEAVHEAIAMGDGLAALEDAEDDDQDF
jgi:hypothetical protein